MQQYQNKNNVADKKTTLSKNTNHLRYTDFQFIRLLGMGAYGKVELVSKKGVKYALKIISKRILAKQGKQYQAFIQRQLLSRMNHPGVVSLNTCFQDRHNLYFCLEYCQGGNFTTFLANNESKITHQLRVFYLAQIVNIIEYFQEIGIVHRDLKPENILLSQKGHLKLIDFATAQVSDCKLVDQKFKQQLIIQKKASEEGMLQPSQQLLDPIKSSKRSWKSTQKSESSSQDHQQQYQQIRESPKRRKATFVGTCYYVPPELLQIQTCCYGGDLWALGCIMYQLYYLNPPFDGASQFQVFQKIKSIDYNFPKNQNITEDAIDLIKKFLQKNPEDRIGCNQKTGLTMKDLKSHKYFSGISFQNLFQQQVPVLMDEQTNHTTQKQLFHKIGNTQIKQYLKILQNNPNILIHGVIQKRTFINYNQYYLIIFKNLKLLRIKILQPGKTRQTQIIFQQKFDNKQNLPAEIFDNTSFKLQTKYKKYKFKSTQPTKWVNTINKKYKQLKQQKQKYKQQKQKQKQQDEQQNQTEQIQKQCKYILQSLRLVKISTQY